MIRYAFSIILASTLLIGEVHTIWEYERKWFKENGQWVERSKINGQWVITPTESWIIDRDVQMTKQENVKNALDQLNYILYFVSFRLYRPNRVNKTTLIVFIVFMVADAMLYFLNYKTWDYGYVYLGLAVSWIWIYRLIKPYYK